MKEYRVIGLMSGTSLDGLDIALCGFHKKNGKWNYTIIAAETLPYDASRRKELESLPTAAAGELLIAHAEYGEYLGSEVRNFLERHSLQADFIASHGHTVFHQPEKKLSFQLGSGSSIAAKARLPVVCDFRSTDIALGGQGAPLVPAGDELLFGDYHYCLNLGGFCNISYKKEGERLAFDVCPLNIAANHYSRIKGKNYDEKGDMGRSGRLHPPLLEELDRLSYYSLPPGPASLSREWLDTVFLPVMEKYGLGTEDKLHCLYEHAAIRVSKCLNQTEPLEKRRVLITGGGAYNSFFMERLSSHTHHELIVPAGELINYKEALVFAFLGVLRWNGGINCLHSVTGASEDSCSGCIYYVSEQK